MAPHSPSLPTPAVSAEQVLVSPSQRYTLSFALPRFLAVGVQLALILLTIHLFKFEPKHPFLAVMCLGAGGFVVHAWLPPRFRLAFFCLLSLVSAVVLLGWSMAGWIIGL